MTPEYEQQADAAEQQAADMERRSEQLGEEIDDARQDWESKKADPAVPGAAGDPDRAEEGGRHPETAYPAKGSDEEMAEEDPAGEERGPEAASDGGEEDAPGEETDTGEERAPREETDTGDDDASAEETDAGEEAAPEEEERG